MAASSPGSSKSPWWRCRARIAPVVCSWHWGRACCCGRPPRTSASTMGRGCEAGRRVGSTKGAAGRGAAFWVGGGGGGVVWGARGREEGVDHGAGLRGWPQVRFNEGRSGPEGRFWVGSMRNNVNPDGTVRDAGGSDGVLMSVGRDAHSATVHQTGFGIANTLCWTPDQRGLIFGDTLANTLYCADYRADWADWADQDGGGVLGQR